MRRTLLLLVIVASTRPLSAGADETAWAASSREPWGIEATVGVVAGVHDDYTRRLQAFGYGPDAFYVEGHYGLAVTRRLLPNLEIVGRFGRLGSGAYTRGQDVATRHFDWDGYGVGGAVRVEAPLVSRQASLVALAEAGGGLAWVDTELSGDALAPSRDTQSGGYLSLGAGLAILGRRIGGQVMVTRVWAPVLHNLLGDVHDVGGLVMNLGVRVLF